MKITNAVRCIQQHPAAGAVFGENYLIDTPYYIDGVWREVGITTMVLGRAYRILVDPMEEYYPSARGLVNMITIAYQTLCVVVPVYRDSDASDYSVVISRASRFADMLKAALSHGADASE